MAKSRTRGFTTHTAGFMLIELLISVVIMTMMSTVVISANSTMSARLQTDNLAHMIALSVREAQTRALSATAPIGVNDAGSVPGYGVMISTAQNTSVRLFEDAQDEKYTSDTSVTSALSAFTLGRGYTISGLEAKNTSGVTVGDVRSVSIYFHRPRPDAYIYYGTGSGGTMFPTVRGTEATITVRSPKGNAKVITVSSTGQISVH